MMHSPMQPAATQEAAFPNLRSLIEQLVATTHQEVDPVRLQTAVEAAERQALESPIDTLMLRVQQAADAVGVLVEARQASLAALWEMGHEQALPLLRVVPPSGPADPPLRVELVLAMRDQSMVLWEPEASAEAPPRWLTGDLLRTRLGLSSDADQATFWIVSPRQPMQAISRAESPGTGATPHGAHGHVGSAASHPHVSPRQRLWGLLASESSDLWVIVAYASVTGLLTLATPIAVQALINQVSFGVLFQPVLVMTVLLLVGLLVSGLLRVLQSSVVELLQARLFVRTAVDVVDRLTRRAHQAFFHSPGREVVTRFLDIATVQKSVAGLLLDGVSLALQVMIGLVVLSFYNPLLLAFATVLLLLVVGVMFVLGIGAVKTSVVESRAKYAMMDWLCQIAYTPHVFQSGNGQIFARRRADDLLRGYVLSRRGHFAVLLRQVVALVSIQAVASAALLGLGGVLVIQRQLTIGQLVAAEIIVSSVLSGLAKLGKHLESYYDLLAGLDKLGYLIDLPAETSDGTEVLMSGTNAGLSLHVQSLKAGHDPHAPDHQPLSWTLQPGQHAVLVGRRWLGQILYGLRSDYEGLIDLDGKELRSIRRDSLRDHITLLSDSEDQFFAGTLLENLLCGRPMTSMAQVRDVLEQVGLSHVLHRWGEGLSQSLPSAAQTLSRNERQRLLLARTLLVHPRLLILDGWESFLDEAQPENWLLRVLEKLSGTTVLWLLEQGQGDDKLSAAWHRIHVARAVPHAAPVGESATQPSVEGGAHAG